MYNYHNVSNKVQNLSNKDGINTSAVKIYWNGLKDAEKIEIAKNLYPSLCIFGNIVLNIINSLIIFS